MSRHGKALILAGTLVVLLVGVVALPVADTVMRVLAWIQQHPAIAWAAFAVTYVVASVLLLPASILTLAAGFLFGLPLGVALVSVSSVAGAAAAFLVGRFLARDWVARQIERSVRFRALDMATRHEGFVIVFLARLSPLFPFNLLNYGLSLTAVSFRDFVVASWIGMLPATVLYVYVGTLAQSLATITSGRVESGRAGQIALVIGFVATIALTVFITRKATSTLRRHLDRELGSSTGGQ